MQSQSIPIYRNECILMTYSCDCRSKAYHYNQLSYGLYIDYTNSLTFVFYIVYILNHEMTNWHDFHINQNDQLTYLNDVFDILHFGVNPLFKTRAKL